MIEVKIMKYSDVEYTCICDYQPYEKAERGPEAQYPGCGEQLTVTQLLDDTGHDITDVIDFFGLQEEVENMAYEQFLKDRGRM